jgi:hypothetical protein
LSLLLHYTHNIQYAFHRHITLIYGAVLLPSVKRSLSTPVRALRRFPVPNAANAVFPNIMRTSSSRKVIVPPLLNSLVETV